MLVKFRSIEFLNPLPRTELFLPFVKTRAAHPLLHLPDRYEFSKETME